MQSWTFLTFGLPHSGKSSFGERISRDYNFVHINLGKILRDLLNTSISDQEKEMIDLSMRSGIMLNREYIYNLVVNTVDGDFDQSIIFDGFPRYESASNDFYNFMGRFGRDINNIILLHFIIDKDRSVALQKVRNPEATEVSVTNRIKQYENEQYPLYNKMKKSHRHFDLYWEQGFENNYTEVTEALELRP